MQAAEPLWAVQNGRFGGFRRVVSRSPTLPGPSGALWARARGRPAGRYRLARSRGIEWPYVFALPTTAANSRLAPGKQGDGRAGRGEGRARPLQEEDPGGQGPSEAAAARRGPRAEAAPLWRAAPVLRSAVCGWRAGVCPPGAWAARLGRSGGACRLSGPTRTCRAGPWPLTRNLPWRQVGESGPRTSTRVTDPSPTASLSLATIWGAMVRSWVAQAVESVRTTTTPSSYVSGVECAATDSPTTSAQRSSSVWIETLISQPRSAMYESRTRPARFGSSRVVARARHLRRRGRPGCTSGGRSCRTGGAGDAARVVRTGRVVLADRIGLGRLSHRPHPPA